MKRIQNEAGIAHLALIVALVVIGFTSAVGYQVFRKRQASRNIKPVAAEQTKPNEQIAPESTQEIQPTNTAASIQKKQAVSKQPVKYDLSTPYGTLNHMEQEVKQGRFSNLAYFTTPRILFRTWSMLNLPIDSDLGTTNSACRNNTICSLVLNSTRFTDNYTTADHTYPYVSGVTGKIIGYNLKDINPPAAKAYGNLSVKIYMIGYGKQWVVDSVTIGSYTF